MKDMDIELKKRRYRRIGVKLLCLAALSTVGVFEADRLDVTMMGTCCTACALISSVFGIAFIVGKPWEPGDPWFNNG